MIKPNLKIRFKPKFSNTDDDYITTNDKINDNNILNKNLERFNSESKLFDEKYEKVITTHKEIKNENQKFIKTYNKSKKTRFLNFKKGEKDEFDHQFSELIEKYKDKGYSMKNLKSNEGLFEPSILLNSKIDNQIVFNKKTNFKKDYCYLKKTNNLIQRDKKPYFLYEKKILKDEFQDMEDIKIEKEILRKEINESLNYAESINKSLNMKLQSNQIENYPKKNITISNEKTEKIKKNLKISKNHSVVEILSNKSKKNYENDILNNSKSNSNFKSLKKFSENFSSSSTIVPNLLSEKTPKKQNLKHIIFKRTMNFNKSSKNETICRQQKLCLNGTRDIEEKLKLKKNRTLEILLEQANNFNLDKKKFVEYLHQNNLKNEKLMNSLNRDKSNPLEALVFIRETKKIVNSLNMEDAYEKFKLRGFDIPLEENKIKIVKEYDKKLNSLDYHMVHSLNKFDENN